MKHAFYTCMTGPDAGYVHNIEPLDHTHFDFYVFHDNYHKPFPGWRSINIGADCPAGPAQHALRQRFVKTMPHLYLSSYAYSVYLDPKWQFTDAFLQLCNDLIAAKPNWLAASHPDRTSFIEEIMFPYTNGVLSFEECKKLVDVLVAEKVAFTKYFSTLCTWIIRRHNFTNQKIGARWFQLLQRCYENNVRDQIVFPFAVHMPGSIDFNLNLKMLYASGTTLNYPNQTRIREVDWQARAPELITYISNSTGLFSADTN